MKVKARARGEDIIDFGMGNPDLATPDHIVDKLVEAARNPRNHRYSASRGITKLRHAITSWYKRQYDVDLDPETEAIATIGSKEGIAHLALAMIGPGDVVLTTTPTFNEGRPVGLLWASPDCKHFSKAKGGKPVSKKIRSLAWVVIKWAKLPLPIRPLVIFLENVEEFQTWGPLGPDHAPARTARAAPSTAG